MSVILIDRAPAEPHTAPGWHDVLRSFASLPEASAFMAAEVDRPASAGTARRIAAGIELRVAVRELGEAAFCNVYDITWERAAAAASLHVAACPVEPPSVEPARGALVTATAGFSFLADRSSGMPRQASLNLAVSEGRIVSLPVADREAVISRAGALSVAHVRASGLLSLNGTVLTWTGSRTGRTADCYAYGNGNAVISHRAHPVTGTARVLDEPSRLTPPIPPGQTMADIGFMAAGGGGFRAMAVSRGGRMDIFSHDIALRCPAALVKPGRPNEMRILQVGCLRGDDLPDSAVSAGPPLGCPDLTAHPVNHDLSLGSLPPFADRRMARMVLYSDRDNRIHLRLFDGRPGSAAFPGVTPTEARDVIAADTGYQWGCFLDPGQTAKLWVHDEHGPASYGNRHYLRWPEDAAGAFGWIPDKGRPVASFITLRQPPAVTRCP
jgi:hypothetical protein